MIRSLNLQSLLSKDSFSRQDIVELLNLDSKDEIDILRQKAYDVMTLHTGEKVYLRGLIEFSNICINDCHYCGIRKSNKSIERYVLVKDEILEAAAWCAEQGYGSLVLQSGERNDRQFIDLIVDLVSSIKKATKSKELPTGLGITLCVGEQSKDTYRRFFDAGAHRYLLRIETSNPELYRQLHTSEQSFDKRVQAIRDLKETGFQVGTGVMIGIPNQTIEDLADDILFFRDMDIDMIGMGPFIVHHQTPMSNLEEIYAKRKQEIYKLALKMIAVSRIVLKDVNIAATTALQAMYPMGREAGLMYGANIIMPMLTPVEYREKYTLYDGKPCLDEFSSDCFECIQKRIESTGRTVALNLWGDSQHFKNKN